MHPVKKLIVLVYLDNIAIAAPTRFAIEWFKQQLFRSFKIKDLEEIKKIPGIKITCDRAKKTLTMDQTKYIKKEYTRYIVS